MLGILLHHGMMAANWPAYAATDPPFREGEAHNLLLVPEALGISTGQPLE
jgi:hypothetical protein